MEAVRQHEREITAYALERLAQVKGITIYGPRAIAVRANWPAHQPSRVSAHRPLPA